MEPLSFSSTLIQKKSLNLKYSFRPLSAIFRAQTSLLLAKDEYSFAFPFTKEGTPPCPNLHLFFNFRRIMRCRGAISIGLTRFELTNWCFGPMTAVAGDFRIICAAHICAQLRLKWRVSGYRSRVNEFTCIKKLGRFYPHAATVVSGTGFS